MTKEKLLELLGGDFQKVVEAVSVKPKPKTADPLNEYNVETHPVFNTTERPDVPRKNKKGDSLAPRKVNRIGLSFEQMIVNRAAAFLCANPIIYSAAPKNPAEERMWTAFRKVNENNKLDYKNQNILTIRMSETEVAEIWYLQDLDSDDDDYWFGTDIKGKQKARLFIASTSYQDTLYPVWDGQDNLVAFARGWKEKTEDGQDIEHFDVYTAEKIYEGVKQSSDWQVDEKNNEVKKIVVIYHSQTDVEWANARTAIRRTETLGSNLGDSNDKTCSPILYVEGEVTSLPDGTTGRVIKGSQGTKVSYVTSDNAPESMKLEFELLMKWLHITTDTVDISTDILKGIGQTSGVALELLFMPAHLKASRHAGTFGECVQRRINLIKRMIVTIDPGLKDGLSLTITPTFDFFLPKDIAGIVNYLSNALMGDRPIISQETAVNTLQGAMGGDGKAEFEKVLKETDNAATALDKQFA